MNTSDDKDARIAELEAREAEHLALLREWRSEFVETLVRIGTMEESALDREDVVAEIEEAEAMLARLDKAIGENDE